MKKYIKSIIIILVIVLIVIIGIFNNKVGNIEKDKVKIVTSFYPIYIMALNICDEAKGIELINMTDVNVGCIHDYTLSTEDMKNIENADIFIENGLGMESFIDKITLNNKKLKIIDSSKDISNLIKDDDDMDGVNPHIWTSIRNYILQVKNITNELKELNPENADIYEKNSEEYVKKLEDLKLKYESEMQSLKGENAINLNESFEYFGKEIGLKLESVKTSHEESALSAEMLKNIIKSAKENNTKIILVEGKDNLKNAQTISNETGAKIFKLDSGETGKLDKDAYLNCMENNLKLLENNLK